MGQITFEGYRRRLDCFEYRGKRRDMPHDADELLELSEQIEQFDTFIVDREYYVE